MSYGFYRGIKLFSVYVFFFCMNFRFFYHKYPFAANAHFNVSGYKKTAPKSRFTLNY